MKKICVLLLITLTALIFPPVINPVKAATVSSPPVEVAYIVGDPAVADSLYQTWLAAEAVKKEALRNKINFYDPCSCVSYAKYKSGINVGSIGAAKNHPINSNLPQPGAIVVFSISSGIYTNTGHLGVVLSVTGNSMFVTEANYVRCEVSTRTILINDPTVVGFYILQ